MSPEPLAAFDATTGHPDPDAAWSRIAPATNEVMALVRVQRAQTLAQA
ncbi:hypothetical protein GIY62_20895 [Burkholderia plantarii]|nr:hypothetical protein GIY62_20895 [Burkholderia plantarii]